MFKKHNHSLLLLLALLTASTAVAGLSPVVAIQGTVGNFNDRYVDLTLLSGDQIRVPRSSIQSKEDEIRPNRPVLAVLALDEISPLTK